jgi:putative sigma-54 modulation protein
MNIKIRAKNFEITPAIDEYVNRKISTLEKFLDVKDNILCEVEIGRTTRHHNSGDIFRAEVNIVEPGNKQIFAVAEEADLYTAIDIVRDEAEREIVSKKTKRTTLFRKGGAAIKRLLHRVDWRKKPR